MVLSASSRSPGPQKVVSWQGANLPPSQPETNTRFVSVSCLRVDGVREKANRVVRERVAEQETAGRLNRPGLFLLGSPGTRDEIAYPGDRGLGKRDIHVAPIELLESVTSGVFITVSDPTKSAPTV